MLDGCSPGEQAGKKSMALWERTRQERREIQAQGRPQAGAGGCSGIHGGPGITESSAGPGEKLYASY